MPKRTVIQWDKDDLEALGLLKVDVLALGMLTAIRKALEMIGIRDARSAGRGPGGLRHDPEGRHRRRVPDRVARADEHAAAPAAEDLLRPGDRGGDRAARADPGRHGASLSAAPARRGAGRLSQRRSKAGARAHPGRADFPGAGDAARHGRGRLHAGRGRPAAALDGGVEEERRPGAVRRAAEKRHEGQRLHVRNSPRRSTARSSASASTAFPNRTRRASRCWSTSPPGSSATTRRHSARRCSTASRWASTPRRSWCRTRAATASRCGRRTCRSAAGIARWRTVRCGWGCAW